MNGTLLSKLRDKKYRDAYVAAHISTGIPHQIKAMRQERRWTQRKLGQIANKPQNVISRLEDPSYGGLTLATLLELASAFDVALFVKFVPFGRFVSEFGDKSPAALYAMSFTDEFSRTTEPAEEPITVNTVVGNLTPEGASTSARQRLRQRNDNTALAIPA